MAQVSLSERDDLTENHLPGAHRFPVLGIHDHAALIEAIRQNFPEIYQNPGVPQDCRPSGEPCAFNPDLHDPAAA